MKSTINGTRYNTETAVLIGTATSSTPYSSDFSYWDAALYRSPRACRYFLAGQGGPMTRFARSSGSNSTVWGAAIIPLTEKEAFDWAQMHLSETELETHFSRLIRDA